VEARAKEGCVVSVVKQILPHFLAQNMSSRGTNAAGIEHARRDRPDFGHLVQN
jgi:hypothetical protein